MAVFIDELINSSTLFNADLLKNSTVFNDDLIESSTAFHNDLIKSFNTVKIDSSGFTGPLRILRASFSINSAT